MRKITRKDKLLYLVPAIWASMFDIIITVIHQPKDYWSGDLTKANEGNPVGSLFMKNHVSGLFVVSGVWIIAIVLLGYFLPPPLRKVFLLFCVIAHSYGASTWLYGSYGFWYAMVLMLFNAILYCWVDNYIQSKGIYTIG